jgi:hypothetical protein
MREDQERLEKTDDKTLLHQKKIIQLLVENGARPRRASPSTSSACTCPTACRTLDDVLFRAPFASLIFTQLLYVIFTHISSSCIACFMQDLPELPQVLKETLQGKHSLLAAAALGNVQVVSEHIAKGADLGARNLRGQTALLLAILNSAQKRSSQENSRRPWTSEEDDLIVRNYWSMDPPPQPNMESGGRLHVSRHRFHLLILTSVECVRAHPPAQACPSCCICFHVVTKCVDLY